VFPGGDMLCFCLGHVKENNVMSPEINESSWSHLPLVHRKFLHSKSSVGLSVDFEFLSAQRIKYLYSEKLLMARI